MELVPEDEGLPRLDLLMRVKKPGGSSLGPESPGAETAECGLGSASFSGPGDVE